MINMMREYKQELKSLRAVKKKVVRDLENATKDAAKQVKAIQTSLSRGIKRTQKELGRIEKREAILEGRLS